MTATDVFEDVTDLENLKEHLHLRFHNAWTKHSGICKKWRRALWKIAFTYSANMKLSFRNLDWKIIIQHQTCTVNAVMTTSKHKKYNQETIRYRHIAKCYVYLWIRIMTVYPAI